MQRTERSRGQLPKSDLFKGKTGGGGFDRLLRSLIALPLPRRGSVGSRLDGFYWEHRYITAAITVRRTVARPLLPHGKSPASSQGQLEIVPKSY
jgi:hypothetical protein